MVGAAPAPLADAGLLAALPADAVGAFHVLNPKALMASRETNRWVGFCTDPAWESAMVWFSSRVFELELSEAELEEWYSRFLAAMEDSTGMVGFLSGPVDPDTDPEGGLIVRGGETTAALLRHLMGENMRAETLEGGGTVLVSDEESGEEPDEESGEEGVSLYYEKDGLIMVLFAATVDDSKALANSCLASLASGAVPKVFGQSGVAERRSANAAIEFALDLSTVFEGLLSETVESESDEGEVLGIGGGSPDPGMDELKNRLLESATSVEWMYGSGELGVGEEAEWNVYLPYDPKSLVGEALGFFGEADKSLLSAAPAGSLSATVASFDISGFSQWALALTESLSKDAHAQAMGALGAAEAAVGVNVLEDIVEPMKGQFFSFSSTVNADDADSLMALTDIGATTWVALTEDTDSLLDLFETVIDMSGMGDAITAEEVSLGDGAEEMEVWRSDSSTGLPLTVGVGHGRLMISTSESGSRSYLERLKDAEKNGGMLDDAALAKAVERTSGSFITIQPTAAFADALEGMGEMLSAMAPELWLDDEDAEWAEGDEELEEIFEDEFEAAIADEMASMNEIIKDLAALGRQYFSGTTTSEVRIKGGLVHIHMQSK